MPRNEQMLTLAQVCEMEPGDKDNPAWINPGFTALVDTLEERSTKTGKKMWKCLLADPCCGATAEMALFTAPKFSQGDLIEVSGQGLRREEYQGKTQIGVGQKTEIHRINPALAKATGLTVPTPTPEPLPDEPATMDQRFEPSAQQPVYGATVGAALNQTLETFRFIYSPQELNQMIKTPHFWAAVHEFSSDFIRVARILEKGKLAPAIKDRVPADFDAIPEPVAPKTPPPAPNRPTGKGKPLPGPDGSVGFDQDPEAPPF